MFSRRKVYGMALLMMLALGGVALAVALVMSYNGLVRLKALVDEAWSGIDVQLKRRYDLIPNLVAVVKGYSIHEKSLLEEIARARAASVGATQPGERSIAEAGLTQSLKTLFAVAEHYPELKANQNFLALQKDLGTIEEELQLARRYYNGAARQFNSTVGQFPARLFAPWLGFMPVAYFEITVTNERNTPRIEF